MGWENYSAYHSECDSRCTSGVGVPEACDGSQIFPAYNDGYDFPRCLCGLGNIVHNFPKAFILLE